LTFCLAVLGFVFRLPHILAVFWPANGVLLGLFIVRPILARFACWMAMLAAFVAAGIFVAHMSVAYSFILAAINLAGIVIGYLAYRLVLGFTVGLNQPSLVVKLCVVAAVAALAEAALGSVFAPIVSDQHVIKGSIVWFSGAFLPYVTLMPAILSARAFVRQNGHKWRRRINARRVMLACLPGALLVVSLVIYSLVGGSEVISLPVIALSYCALSYSVFITSLTMTYFTVWTIFTNVYGLAPVVVKSAGLPDIVLLRMTIAFIVLAPLIIASVMAAHDLTVARWRSLAEADGLTGVFNSRGFYWQAQILLRMLHARRRPIGVLMIDLDHFKQVNDTYGHGAGDGVLRMAADLLRQGIRDNDICGRLGGDELVALIAEKTLAEVQVVAERIRASIEQCLVSVEESESIRFTVSIGLYFANFAPGDLIFMLRAADEALYLAKNNGRNRVWLWNQQYDT
jgi:diguanylate cyclase (GGDEF)-like protein